MLRATPGILPVLLTTPAARLDIKLLPSPLVNQSVNVFSRTKWDGFVETVHRWSSKCNTPYSEFTAYIEGSSKLRIPAEQVVAADETLPILAVHPQ